MKKPDAPDRANLFAEALERYYRTGKTNLLFQRDDGYVDEEDLSWYLASYRSFPGFEKQALKFARGRVLDVGCGPGRHALYLQRRGLQVTCIDNSPLMIALASERGVKDVRRADFCSRLPFRQGEFDTALLLGNNLGICGTPPRFRRMLRELGRVTSSQGRIIGATRMPGMINPIDRAYIRRNLEDGKPAGQIRLRHVLDGDPGNWFDLLFFAPADLMAIAASVGWHVVEVLTEIDFEDGYAVVMEKQPEADGDLDGTSGGIALDSLRFER